MLIRPTNRAVASAANVSTGTVSNVLNRPHAVAGDTRERVERAMAALGFPRQAPADRSAADQGSHCGRHEPQLRRETTVLRHGVVVGSGLIECSMLDGSGTWVRFDDGRGRLLLTSDEGYEIRPVQGPPPRTR